MLSTYQYSAVATCVALLLGSEVLQCFDSCLSSPALLGIDSTIGNCCGIEGRGGGGFLLQGAILCVDCEDFQSMSWWTGKMLPLIMYVSIDAQFEHSLFLCSTQC